MSHSDKIGNENEISFPGIGPSNHFVSMPVVTISWFNPT